MRVAVLPVFMAVIMSAVVVRLPVLVRRCRIAFGAARFVRINSRRQREAQ